MRAIDSDGVERIDVRVSVVQLARANQGDPVAIGNVIGGCNYWEARPENQPADTPPIVVPSLPPAYVNGPTIYDAIFGQQSGRRETGEPFTTHALSVAFGFPVGATTYAHEGQVSAYEFRGPPFQRYATVSRHPFDFRHEGSGPIAVTGGLTPSFFIGRIGPDGREHDGSVRLEAGVTYYFNVCNLNPHHVDDPDNFPIWITDAEVREIAEQGIPASWPLGYEIIWPHN